MDTGHLGYPFRKLGVAYPFPPDVHFPQEPICPGAHSQVPICPKYSFSPRTNLPQVPIYFGAYLPRVPFCHLSDAHMLRCPFALNTHLPQVSVYSKFSISPKYPFASVPSTCHRAYHFSKCPFTPSTQLFGTQMSGTRLSGTQMYGPQITEPFILVPNCPGLKCTGTNCPRPICLVPIHPGAHLSWCPFVLVPICPGPICPKTVCYTPHLHLTTSKLLQVFGYHQMAQFTLRRHCLFR